MLLVLDDFDRVVVEINKFEDENLKKGVELIYEKLKSILVGKGLEQVEIQVGDVFNVDVVEVII